MNPFERRNLERLKATNPGAANIAAVIRAEGMAELNRNAERIARVLVWAYFDEGLTPAQVKERLRADADIFNGLNLTTIINDTYQAITQPVERRRTP